MKTFLADDMDDLIDHLPREPGVYLLKDEDGRTIYVGKSMDMGKRVRSHLSQAAGSSPIARVDSVDYIATESGLEALILECNLIKRLRPLYNARLRDDKSYPYIKVSTGEEFPAIHVTRTVRDDGAVYLGPYADVGSARRTIKILREIFPIRRCRRRMDRPSRPCLDYHIRRCSGPCTGEVDPERYRTDVVGIIGALEGRKEEIIENLRSSMYSASCSRNYERAAVLRDRLEALERTTLHQRLSLPGPGNADVLGLSVIDENACVQMLFLRDGAIIDQEHFILEAVDSTTPEILTSFVKEYYSSNPVPPRILVPVFLEEKDVFTSWFAARSGRQVEIAEPSVQDEKRLTSMANRNAELMLRLERRIMGDSLKKGLQDLARVLDLPYLPRVIEAYDMSSTAGKGAVGSMVRFRWGRPNRSLYRKFRIKSAAGRDDYAMMREVVSRRFRGALHHEEKLPDLVLVDGGPGQASAAVPGL